MSEQVKWPDHEWAGDEYGHACAKCEEACPWYCDKVAHNLGEFRVQVIVCYTKCWSCQFGEHTSEWHTWADEEDIDHAAKTGQPDPSTSRCGCYCQRKEPLP